MKLTKIVLALMLCASPVIAQDGLGQKAWDTIKAQDNFHFLDNATPSYLYDFVNKESLGGISSMLYYPEKLYTSIDIGVAKSLDNDSTFPFPAINIHWGDLLVDKTEWAGKLRDKFGKHDLIGKLTLQAWGGRDFAAGVWRGGIGTGVEIKWGGFGFLKKKD